MKNWKRILAWAGVILVCAAALLPLVFAFGKGEEAGAWFRAAIGVAVLLPVLLYAFVLVYRHYKKDPGGAQGKNRQVDSIIFDMGNVLVNFDWESYLDSFHFPQEKRRALEKAMFLSDDWNERDRGVPDEEILNRFIAAAPEYEADVRKLFAGAHETIKPFDYAETWVKYLKSQGYHLYVLSNYCATTLKKTRHLMPLKYMDGIVFSCDVKAIKPEPEIYHILLDSYGIDPRRAVFLDDREENLETARKLGLHTILFRDFKQAAADLEKLGVV